MRYLSSLVFSLIFSLSLSAYGQYTVASGTITDTDGFVWSNAKIQATFVPNPSFPDTNQYSINGQSLNNYINYLNQNVVTNSSGAFSVTVLDNTLILPSGSSWKFIIQSNTSAPASSLQPIQLYGSSYSLTSFVNSNIYVPRFAASPGVFGYGDVELTTVPFPGGQYFNTTTLLPRYWNGATWNNYGTGGVSNVVLSINSSTGAFTFTGNGVSCTTTTCTFTQGSSGGGASFNLNIAEMGALTTGMILTHTGHYVVPLAQTTAQINALLAAAPNATYEFQNGDSVYNSFTNANFKAKITHNGIYYFTNTINWDQGGVVCDARQANVTFTQGSTAILASSQTITNLDIGKVLWIYNTTTNTAYETQIQSINGYTLNVATPAPWTQTTNIKAWIGTDNTTNAQAALTLANAYNNGPDGNALAPPFRLSLSAGACMTHTLNPSGAGFVGAGIMTSIVGAPSEDVFASPDAYTTPTSQGLVHISDLTIVVEGGTDATLGTTKVNDAGTTTIPAFYRPAYVMTRDADYPLDPAWIQGSSQNNAGATNGVANTTASATSICFLTGTAPVIGQEIMFPYLSTGLFETTVSSVGSSCTGGTTYTLGAALPVTATQAEYFQGTSIQHTNIDFPATRTYPFTLTVANPLDPDPAYPVGVAPYGLMQIGAERCTWYNVSMVSPYSFTITSCSGTAVDHPSGSFIAPLNRFKPQYPFPVIPSINTNDTTPTTASWFPGHNIGNCAFAFPQSNGLANQGSAWFDAHIENLNIVQTNVQNFNNTCGFYFVGLPYATHFNDIAITSTEYGIIEALPSIENHNWIISQPTADGTTWNNLHIHAGYIWDIINANQNSFSNVDAYSQLGSASGTQVGCGGAFFFSKEYDDQQAPIYGTGGMSLSHNSNLYIEPESGSHCGQEALLEFDGNSNIYTDFHMGGGGQVFISGVDQHFLAGNLNNASPFGAAPIINYGNGTSFDYTEFVGESPWCNVYEPLGKCEFINWGPKTRIISRTDDIGPFGSPVWGNNRRAVDGQTNETFNTGNMTAPYTNSDWGFISPDEFSGASFDPAPMNHNLWTFDVTAPVTQSNAGCTVGTSSSTIYCAPFRFNEQYISIGPGQRLNGSYMFYLSLKSGLATNTASIGLGAVCNGVSSAIYGPFSIPVTSSWPATAAAVFSTPVNLTPYNGCVIQLIFYGSASADVDYVQFADFAPLPENFNVQKMSIVGSSGQPTITNTNGGETWQPAAPTTGCGTTYANGFIWHNLAGSASGTNRFYICDSATSTWNAKF